MRRSSQKIERSKSVEGKTGGLRAGRADAWLESFASKDGALDREWVFKQNGKAEEGPPCVGRFVGIGGIPASFNGRPDPTRLKVCAMGHWSGLKTIVAAWGTRLFDPILKGKPALWLKGWGRKKGEV